MSQTVAAADALIKNLERAEKYLARFKATTVPHFIAGQPDSGSGETFDNLSPVDNSVLCKVASGNVADVDRAAQAAASGFPAWRAVEGAKRRTILHKIADRIEARAEEIAIVESIDTGQPIRYMSSAALRAA
jgi:5-carboxymethyl-2-hydroxymuconic-semialdehyde dehydrogenase